MTEIKIPWSRHLTAICLLPVVLAGCGGDNDDERQRSADSRAARRQAAAASVPFVPKTPLERLVKSHLDRSGTPLASTQQAVARQLGIQVDEIADYTKQPAVAFPATAGVGDNARTAAALIDTGIKLGAQPLMRVGTDLTDDAPRLVSFNFKNATNYDFFLERTDGAVNAAGQLHWDPVYGGLINGNPRTAQNSRLCRETVNGFHHTGREDYLRTRGNPARIEISARNKLHPWLQSQGLFEPRTSKIALFEFTIKEQDLSNRSMADFVREVQAREHQYGPVQHSLFTLDPNALGTATFPSGARFYTHLQTHFSKAGPAYSMPSDNFPGVLRCMRENDLPRPKHTMGAFGQALRVKHSINATAWNAMKAALNIP